MQYRDELKDRETLKRLYAELESYRKVADKFAELTGADRLHANMVRWLCNGYEPGREIRKQLHWPGKDRRFRPTVEVRDWYEREAIKQLTPAERRARLLADPHYGVLEY